MHVFSIFSLCPCFFLGLIKSGVWLLKASLTEQCTYIDELALIQNRLLTTHQNNSCLPIQFQDTLLADSLSPTTDKTPTHLAVTQNQPVQYPQCYPWCLIRIQAVSIQHFGCDLRA